MASPAWEELRWEPLAFLGASRTVERSWARQGDPWAPEIGV